MIKNEWKSLLRNKLMLIVVIAIIVIPIIYAGLFLKSMWDPYGNVDSLPVAVVNEDKPVEYNGKTLSIGKDMTDELKDNDSMAFNIVDSKTAEDGLANGTYYMVITIPEDFSANASTVMDDNPKQMELSYQTNPGTNYIASKLSETAILKLRDNIAAQVTETYTETVFDSISEAGDGMQEAADGSGKIEDGLSTVADGNKTITKNLKKLSTSTLTFVSGADSLTEGLKTYTDGVAQVNDGAKSLDDGAKQLNSGVATLTEKVPELTEGVDTLDKGVQQYTAGVDELNENSDALKSGASSLESGAKALSEGINTLSSGTTQYVSGADTLADGTTAYVKGAEQLAAGAKQLSGLEKLGDVSNGISQLNQAVTKGSDKSQSLVSGTQQLEAGLKSLNDTVSSLKGSTTDESIKTLSAGLASAKQGMNDAADGMTAAATGMNNAADGINNAAGYISQAAGITSQTSSSISNELIPAVQNAGTQFSQVGQQINDLLTGYGQTTTEKLTEANTTISTAQQSMSNAAAALQAIQASASEDGTVSAESLSEVIGALNDAAGGMSGVDGSYMNSYSEQASQPISTMQG